MSNQASSEFLALQTALLGRYSLVRELGRGGMGIVFLAHEVALDRPVALKLLPPEMAAQPRLRERFLREARTAAKLSHPNIVPIHSVDEVDGFVFFAMAYIEGETLGERIRGKGPLPAKTASKVLSEVAWALAYAHGQGVVHRDVKPDNILLEEASGRALVTDFGIAALTDESGLTASGEVLGTAEFMSPEQASGERVDARSDVYALGAVGFYVLTGRHPFQGESTAALLAKHITQPAPSVAEVAPEAPRGLVKAVDVCLRKAPEERFPDGMALAEFLSEDAGSAVELPMPLRIFIGRMREMPQTSLTGFVLFLCVLPVFIAFWGEGGYTTLASLMGVMTALVLGVPLSMLALHVRKLLASGFGIDDAVLALEQDVKRRTEEVRHEFEAERTGLDRWSRILYRVGAVTAGVAGVGLTALMFATADVSLHPLIRSLLGPLATAFLGGTGLGVAAGLVRAYREKRLGDPYGERWLSVLKSRFGRALFGVSGIGLKDRALEAGSAHRPTELAIGMAADRLFAELPKSLRKELGDLPRTVTRLESEAQAMRSQIEDLERVLLRLDAEGAGVLDEERERVRREVAATREEAEGRLRQAVTSLETIRLGLLRLHAGEEVVEHVTMEISAAQRLTEAIGRLLEGRDEVERLLAASSTAP